MIKCMCGETGFDRFMDEYIGEIYIREDMRACLIVDDIVRLWIFKCGLTIIPLL